MKLKGSFFALIGAVGIEVAYMAYNWDATSLKLVFEAQGLGLAWASLIWAISNSRGDK